MPSSSSSRAEEVWGDGKDVVEERERRRESWADRGRFGGKSSGKALSSIL